MKLSEIKNQLTSLDKVVFNLPDGSQVPQHFHVTEVGIVTKDFIDCGGTVRQEKIANFQLWEADDFDHRLGTAKISRHHIPFRESIGDGRPRSRSGISSRYHWKIWHRISRKCLSVDQQTNRLFSKRQMWYAS